ncbi:hypothetical protein D9757_005753 [Collybiopsis confluens]|uniref:Uncharacterized protein n=1 Tax=Collybiopsis confluens TaxID=2823264 RepID=A0A8H5MB97_9AGAR|nr:hypothetical protein D9757_005753 [Collybiopsis confluens]
MMLFPSPLHFVLALCLAFPVFIVNASPVSDSNGYRLARGLPPLPPRNFGRNKPGYAPTPVRRGTSPSPSPSGVTQYTGRLEVRSDNGSVVGYVQDKPGLPVAGNYSDLKISITASLNRKEHLNVAATESSALPSIYNYVGASSNKGADMTIGKGDSSTLLFTNVQRSKPLERPDFTPAHPRLFLTARPMSRPSNASSAESSIWKLDSKTKELTAQYVNPDGTLPSTFLVYDSASGHILFTGDVGLMNSSSIAQIGLFVVD